MYNASVKIMLLILFIIISHDFYEQRIQHYRMLYKEKKKLLRKLSLLLNSDIVSLRLILYLTNSDETTYDISLTLMK